MPQTHASPQPFEDEPIDAAPGPAPQTSASTDALDSLLDQIDSTLQTNAAEFVRSFVQKGGQ